MKNKVAALSIRDKRRLFCRAIYTNGRRIVFGGPPCREIDPRTFTKAELRDIMLRHGYAMEARA